MKKNITIDIWYGEKEERISKISNSLLKYLRMQIIDHVLIPSKIYDSKSDYFLSLTLVFDLNTLVSDLKGPELSNDGKFEQYGFWLPYKKISKSENTVYSFVCEFFYLLDRLVLNLNLIPSIPLSKLKSIILDEVENNPLYVDPEGYKTPDISSFLADLDLD